MSIRRARPIADKVLRKIQRFQRNNIVDLKAFKEGKRLAETLNQTVASDTELAKLHPAWQYEILKLYSDIGTGNQFIVATHSPQVLASTSWKNVQVLERTSDGVKLRRLVNV